MSAYYNEIDPYAAQWLRNLIQAELIAPGDVDERDIKDVRPNDLTGYTQCHFFAGIGGWSYALRLAGWPDDRPVWTGSCPCQPFSQAGKRKGTKDERHLWPEFYRLIKECRPSTVFGEQVASKDGKIWLSGVRTDMEAVGSAFGAADLCAAGVSAPHARQRLYWVADANGVIGEEGSSIDRRRNQGSDAGERTGPGGDGLLGGVVNSNSDRCSPRHEAAEAMGHRNSVDATSRSNHGGVVNADGYHEHWWSGPVQVGWNGCQAEIERGGRKYRAQWRIKPGLSLLAYGIPGRVGRISGYGNAIMPQLAAEFISAYMEIQ